MPEAHEDPNAFKVQTSIDRIMRDAAKWRKLKADIAASKALVASLRAFVGVSSGDIMFPEAKAKAPTWAEPPNPKAVQLLVEVNKAIKLIEDL